MALLFRHKTFFDIFPAPEFLLISSTGIAVTDYHIKFVELKREMLGRGFKLSHSAKLDLPEGAVEGGLINDSAKVSMMLRKLSEKYGIRYAHATLPEENAYLFTTIIKKVPREGMRDAVAFIIEENVPVTLADSIFDFEIIEENSNTGDLRIAVSVLPKTIVESYTKAFEDAGITPISFNIESQAVARAVIHKGDKRAHLIVNLSANKSGLYVVEDEVVQFSITPAYGFGEDDSYSGLADLRSEIRKVIAFWNTKENNSGNPSKEIQKIVLCGFGAGKKDYVKKLMEGNEARYVLADVWVNTSPSRNYVPDMPFEESLGYASTIGLVLPNYK